MPTTPPQEGAHADPSAAMNRRNFLRKAGAVAGVAAAGAAGGYELWDHVLSGSPTRAARRRPPVTTTTTTMPPSTPAPNGMTVPTAQWLIAENQLPGSPDWIVGGHQTAGGIEGFASVTSAVAGDVITLYVNTGAPSFHVEAYRLGWYGGVGGRLVWTSQPATGIKQPPASFTSGINMVECEWSPTMRFAVDGSWPPGVYLLKLVGSGGEQQWVPLTIRDDTSKAAFLVQNSVTTWQAYNLWGGYSLYYGKAGSGQSFANRSRVVSFDRPYPLTWANGAADLIGNELPLILLMEKMGLDVTYWTDIDMGERPQLLTNHSALLSLGHDEYWSVDMRNGATQARDKGVNLVFLGANACFRRIRFDDSPAGPGRRQVCYKDASEDPLAKSDPTQVTANWPDPPAAEPQSTLIGSLYQSNPVNADLVVGDAGTWLTSGTGLESGQHLAGTVGSEYDRYDTTVASPENVEILAHSPLVCRGQKDYSDVTWYTTGSGAGVLATGSNWWISKLVDTSQIPVQLLPGPFKGVTPAVTAMTQNILAVVGNGPAATHSASKPNWDSYYAAKPGGPSGWQGDKGA